MVDVEIVGFVDLCFGWWCFVVGGLLMCGYNVYVNGICQYLLYYKGNGLELLLIFGIILFVIIWGFVVECLIVSFDVYVLDVCGCGLLEVGDLDYLLDVMVDDVIVLVGGMDSLIVLGYLMGVCIVICVVWKLFVLFFGLILVDLLVLGLGCCGYLV